MNHFLLFPLLTAVALVGCANTAAPLDSTNKKLSSQEQEKSLLPIEIVYQHIQQSFDNEPTDIEIKQEYPRGEHPLTATVTVISSGFLDDSVSAEKTQYFFKKNNNKWERVSQNRSFLCYRGENTKTFQSSFCP